MAIEEYFSGSYSAARAKFLAAAQKTDSDVFAFRLPGRTGPEGEDLVVDVAGSGRTMHAICCF